MLLDYYDIQTINLSHKSQLAVCLPVGRHARVGCMRIWDETNNN